MVNNNITRMQSSNRLFAANPKNIRLVNSSRERSKDRNKPVFPTNKPYLQNSQQQSTFREFNREKIIEQNKKLKEQVLELAKQMQNIVGQNQKKKKYGIRLEQQLGPRGQIQKQEVVIAELKSEIFKLKKQNEYTYDEKATTEKENAVKMLEGQIKLLQSEKSGLVKVRKEQEKALSFLTNNDGYNEKIAKSRSQLVKLKEECKILAIKTAQNQKLLLKAHQKTVGKNKKIKQVEQRIRTNKQKLKKGQQHVVTIQMISEIQEEIVRLEAQFKELQKNWQDKIHNVQIEHSNRRAQQQLKLVVLKDKQREAKLNEIRLKQFRKLILQGRNEGKQQEQMKDFRHKRNIKYLQKTP